MLICGRQWGKTTLLVAIGLERVTNGQRVGYFLPTTKMASEVWRSLRSRLDPITRDRSELERRIETYSGGVLELWSVDNPEGPRGRHYDAALVDEARFMPKLQYIVDDVIKPTLFRRSGDLWIATSPRGAGYLKTLFQRGKDAGADDWASWRRPTWWNPYIRASELTRYRGDVPDRTFRQEVAALFISDAGAVFRYVRRQASAPALDGPAAGRTYVAGVDWGKSNDFTVVAIMDAASRRLVALDRFNNIGWRVQSRRVAATLRRWRVAVAIVEQNSIGDVLLERLAEMDLPVVGWTATNATKCHIIDTLSNDIETGRLTFPHIPQLIIELESMETQRTPSGLYTYNAPAGFHDDTVIALALANAGADSATVDLISEVQL